VATLALLPSSLARRMPAQRGQRSLLHPAVNFSCRSYPLRRAWCRFVSGQDFG
jgi:hypothetical protein